MNRLSQSHLYVYECIHTYNIYIRIYIYGCIHIIHIYVCRYLCIWVRWVYVPLTVLEEGVEQGIVNGWVLGGQCWRESGKVRGHNSVYTRFG